MMHSMAALSGSANHAPWLSLTTMMLMGCLIIGAPTAASAASVVEGIAVANSDKTMEDSLTPADDEGSDDDIGAINHGQRQIDWVRQNGGFVSDKYDIRREFPNDPTSRLAVFAKDDIEKGELLLSIPRTCLVQTFDNDICDTVDLLVKEMALGNGSHYEPYTTYLKSQTYGQLPSHFTDTGKNLLNQLIGARARSGLQFLPPKNLVSVDWGCFDPKAPLDHQQAALLVVQRGWDEVLIPVYDMISHRNGKHWYNTREVYSVHHPQEPVQVVATRNVAKGEELYTSYDGCLDCGGRSTGYGTSEILRDYGFVEMYPQRWNFKEQGVSFTLDYKYDKTTGKPVKGDKELQLKWSRKPATVKVQFFEQQVKRLETFKEQHKLDDLNAKPEEMPQHEWDTLRQYHGALMTTMQTLIAKIEQDGNDGREIDYDDDDDNEEEEEED
mmetsp:Transcript_5984/g.16793  ORF Transcript_5984/g.16793 Transcript_5984/m.16793 type:complete len:441 (+) Transcript_5984:206-1528(+)